MINNKKVQISNAVSGITFIIYTFKVKMVISNMSMLYCCTRLQGDHSY